MALDGRIEGKVSADGSAYELWRMGELLKSTPIEDAKADPKHRASIKRNGWEALP